jgi:hypothetical protein
VSTASPGLSSLLLAGAGLPAGQSHQVPTGDGLAAVAAALNSRPRKTLGWRTPAEALNDHLRSLQQGRVATTP